MLKKLKSILLIFVCIVGIYFIVKQIYLINYLEKNGIHSEGKVYDWCTTCILVDLKDSQVTHSGLRIGTFFPMNYRYGDWINVIYDKNNKNKIIIDDAIHTIYFPYGALSFLLIILPFLIR